jgi:hypothetical protein
MKRTTISRPNKLVAPRKREAGRLDVPISRGARRAIKRPIDSIVERTTGAFKGYGPTLTIEELREAAETAIAEDVAERSSN